MQKILHPEVKPDPIVRGAASRRPPLVPFNHPVAVDVGVPVVAGGDDDSRLPVGWDAPGSCPLVDSIRGCTNLVGQRLAGGPGVDQVAYGVFLCHA